MDDPDPGGPVTRLGPDSGGRLPNEPAVTYREWSWTSDPASSRRGLPFIGVFLVAFGLLLVLEQSVPGTSAWTWIPLAAGAAAIVVGISRRSRSLIELGVVLGAIGLPSVLSAAGLISGPGWGTFFLGAALIGIGLVRAARGGGIGWLVWVGGGLALFGLARIGIPTLGGWLLPLAIIVLGALLVGRALVRPR
jgi:hypothetical protein